MDYKILGSVWYTPTMPGVDLVSHVALDLPSLAVGFVAIASGPKPGDWKCYMGIALGQDKEHDALDIAAHGQKVSNAVAIAHFPNLPAEALKF